MARTTSPAGPKAPTTTANTAARPATARAYPEPPVGWARVRWLGPGFLWMVSAAGSGELLFTPRIGSLYRYALIWALVAAVALKWFVNREIGRYTVVTGRTLLHGFSRLPGPRGWAVWLIVVPQLVVAVATIAGLAGSAGTALIVALPGDVRLWTIAAIATSTALVAWGRYTAVERVATWIAIALGTSSVVAAATVFDSPGDLAAGVVPSVPAGTEIAEVLPWLGFMLSGAAGMIWYSYWIRSKGYGRARHRGSDGTDLALDADDVRRARGWLRQMTFDNSVAVVGTLVITLAFLVLGAELLAPRDLVPEEDRIAEVLGELLGGVWGRAGFWFMILAVFVGFWDTVLSDQDGFGRMFADSTRILAREHGARRVPSEAALRRGFVVVLLAVVPVALYLARGNPVGLLKLAGAIEAAHIPVLAGLTLYLNRREVPSPLAASRPVTIATAAAGIFFAAFAVFYVVEVV